MLPPELAGCAKLVILDISGNGITGAAIPPGLLSGTNLARLWREGCPIDEAELSALPGYVRRRCTALLVPAELVVCAAPR
jgi:hypothetical protein